MNIGEKIKELRNDKSLTQVDFAKKLKISRSALSLYETGKRQVPNELILLIAKTFNIKTDFLFGLED